MAKNMLPNEAIGSVGPVCCWGNIGEYQSPSNEVVAKKDLSCNRFVAAKSRNIRRAKRWRRSLEYVYCCMVNRSQTIEMVLDKKKKEESQDEEFPCGNCF